MRKGKEWCKSCWFGQNNTYNRFITDTLISQKAGYQIEIRHKNFWCRQASQFTIVVQITHYAGWCLKFYKKIRSEKFPVTIAGIIAVNNYFYHIAVQPGVYWYINS